MTILTAAALSAPIPGRARAFGWLLVLAGCFFAYVYTMTPDSFFPGVSVESYSERFGLYSTGVRILGSVLGILAALLIDSAALLALMLLTRIFIELGDICVGLVLNGAPDANSFTLLALAGVEVYMFLFLVGRVRRG